MDNQDVRRDLARFTGMREDVIEALPLEEGKLNHLFKNAARAKKWEYATTASLVGSLGATLVMIGSMASAVSGHAVNDTAVSLSFAAMISGVIGANVADKCRSRHAVAGELKSMAYERLYELDQQGRQAQAPTPTPN